MAARIINVQGMSPLKKTVSGQFAAKLHYSGSCSGQNFTMDSSSEELRCFLVEYFGEKGLPLKISDDGLRFYAVCS